MALRVNETIAIPEEDLEERFTLSSGPGGQHVNKVATGVQLRFNFGRTKSLPPWVRERLRQMAGRRLSNDGVLTIESTRHRSLKRNREDARGRLLELLKAAATRPRVRRPTRPTRGSKERRLNAKRQRSKVKARRQRPPPE